MADSDLEAFQIVHSDDGLVVQGVVGHDGHLGELRRTEGRDAHPQRVGRRVIPDDPSVESPHFDGANLSKSKSSASATFSAIMVVVAPVSISAWQVLVEFASVGSGPTFAGDCGWGSLGVLDRLALTTPRGRCAGSEYARIHDRDRKRVSGEVPRSEAFLRRRRRLDELDEDLGALVDQRVPRR